MKKFIIFNRKKKPIKTTVDFTNIVNNTKIDINISNLDEFAKYFDLKFVLMDGFDGNTYQYRLYENGKLVYENLNRLRNKIRTKGNIIDIIKAIGKEDVITSWYIICENSSEEFLLYSDGTIRKPKQMSVYEY